MVQVKKIKNLKYFFLIYNYDTFEIDGRRYSLLLLIRLLIPLSIFYRYICESYKVQWLENNVYDILYIYVQN